MLVCFIWSYLSKYAVYFWEENSIWFICYKIRTYIVVEHAGRFLILIANNGFIPAPFSQRKSTMTKPFFLERPHSDTCGVPVTEHSSPEHCFTISVKPYTNLRTASNVWHSMTRWTIETVRHIVSPGLELMSIQRRTFALELYFDPSKRDVANVYGKYLRLDSTNGLSRSGNICTLWLGLVYTVFCVWVCIYLWCFSTSIT